MVDAAAQREEALERIGNVRLNLFRRHSVVERRHHNDRDVDLRKEIDRHTRHGGHANHGNHKADHEDEEGVAECEARHYWPSCASPAAPAAVVVLYFAVTSSPGSKLAWLATITCSPS